jgi:penicillin-insensitive murein endopeptidase
MAQPRGGPMITGHWSHQVGLDADIWLTPMPDRELTRQEREEMMATNVVNDKWTDVRPDVWSEKYIALYKMLAQDLRIERVLANPAIKKALCRDAKGDRSWLHKIRPVVGHNYHFHIRIGCPADSPGCKGQTVPPTDEGCGKELDAWFKKPLGEPKPSPAAKPILMSALPQACKLILSAPSAASTQPASAQMPATKPTPQASHPARPPARHEPIPE